MSSSGLIRLSGLAAIASGALLVVAELLYLVVSPDLSAVDFTGASYVAYVVQAGLFLLAQMLLPGALVGFYAGRSESMGTLGLVGFLTAFVGTVLAVGLAWDAVFVIPTLAREDPALLESTLASVVVGEVLSFGLFTLGWLLFGVVALRARVFPRVAAVVLIVGAVLAFFPLPLSTVAFGAAVAWIGLGLFLRRAGATWQSARVS